MMMNLNNYDTRFVLGYFVFWTILWSFFSIDTFMAVVYTLAVVVVMLIAMLELEYRVPRYIASIKRNIRRFKSRFHEWWYPIHPQLIRATRDLRNDEKDPQRRWLDVFDLNHGRYRFDRLDTRWIKREEAVYVVEQLNRWLREESSSPRPPVRTTGLHIHNPNLSDEAFEVFCDFLSRTDDLAALSLNFNSGAQHRRLLNALHNNTSVKELTLPDLPNTMSGAITELMQSRADIEALHLEYCGFSVISCLLPFLRQSLRNLRKLSFHFCELDNDKLDQIVQALVAGNHSCLQELDLSLNDMVSSYHTLQSLCALNPSSFPSLQKLNLSGNPAMFKDTNMTKAFIQTLLLSTNTTLKELYIRNCSFEAIGYTSFLKALETNRTLELLDMTINRVLFEPPVPMDEHAIRNQFVESLPKMMGIQHLIAEERFFDEHDKDLMTAYRRNVSLSKLSAGKYDSTQHEDVVQGVNTPNLVAILKRQKRFIQVESLLGRSLRTVAAPTMAAPPPTTTYSKDASNASTTCNTCTTIPLSLWALVLATVGRDKEGSSVVFMMLQDQVGHWQPETRSMGGGGCDENKKECEKN